MKSAVLLSWFFWGGMSAGRGHDKHGGWEWTKEELAELEAKWGTDVRFSAAFQR